MAKNQANNPDNPAEGAKSGRTLLVFEHNDIKYLPNELFEGSEEEVASHHAAGNIDAHPDAVAVAVKKAKAPKGKNADEAIED